MRTWAKTSGYAVLGAIGLWCAAPVLGQEAFPKELQAKFQELDADGNGELSPRELADARAFAQGDVDKDGKLTPLEAYRLHLIRTGKGLGSTQRLLDGFREADQDKNGSLSLEEFPTGGGPFKAMDRDKDGELTLSEAVRYQVALEMAELLLDEDLDQDGKLSPDELPAAARPFLPIGDLDKDGKLNEQEIYTLVVEFRLAILAVKAERSGANPPKESRPGQATQGGAKPKPSSGDEQGARAGSGKDVVSRLQLALASLDADADGKLQASEVVLSRALLRSLDRDRDGALDRAELDLAAGRRDRLVARARAIGERIQGAGLEATLVAIRPELEGLVAAGRIQEAELLLDEVELRLLRAGKR